MRYYSTQRPVTPGSFPKPAGNQVEQIVNFPARTYVDVIWKQAWGYIDYEKALNEEEAEAYELVAGGAFCNALDHGYDCTGCVNELADRDMDCCWNCSRNMRTAKKDLFRHRPVK